MNLITDTEVAAILGVTLDANLTRIVKAVQDEFRRATGRTFERVERTEYLPGFGHRVDFIFSREAPIVSIAEIRVDAAGELGAGTAEDVTGFTFNAGQDDFRIFRSAGYTYPDGSRVVMLTYTAGYWPHDDTDTSHTPKLPEDLRDGLIEEVIARWRRGTSEQMQSENVSGIGGFTRFKAGTTPQFDRIVSRYKRPI